MIIASICTGIVIGFLPFVIGNPEKAAEATICQEMASQVLSGEASRFDYMATRCSARFLVPAEEG